MKGKGVGVEGRSRDCDADNDHPGGLRQCLLESSLDSSQLYG